MQFDGGKFTSAIQTEAMYVTLYSKIQTYSINSLFCCKNTCFLSRNFLVRNTQFIELSGKDSCTLKIALHTPETLGADRLAGIVGASKLFPAKNVLVIDMGTCIKYDFLSQKREYAGGSISPGLNMRLKALHDYTERLPLLQPAQ